MRPRVLTVAGSDSGGGAGIQADIKTITAMGGYASSAITALTAQDTHAVYQVVAVDPFLVERQMCAVLDDLGADAIKIGMLHSAHTVELVARVCEGRARSIPIVLDPVFESSSGTSLLNEEGRRLFMQRLLPLAALITPNIHEAELLSGVHITTQEHVLQALDQFQLHGVNATLITGGHLAGDVVVDVLRTADGEQHSFEHERLATRCTHGTGCTLTSAIAVGLAKGLTLHTAVAQARAFVFEAMRAAVPMGQGRAPLDHAWQVQELQ